MAGSVNLVDEYVQGSSLATVAKNHGIPITRVRTIMINAGVLRSRQEASDLASERGRLGGGMRGKKLQFTQEHKNNISAGRLKWGEENAAGFSVKAKGYVEHTRGENKGRGVHRTIMEKKLGRKLLTREHVHHSDEVRSNNSEDNLSVLPIADHARLHRLQEIESGKIRERDVRGRYR